jgi:perosamine synthetase
MIIPRYRPTYTFTDLIKSWILCQKSNATQELGEALGKLYSRKYVFLFGNARAALYVLLKAYNRLGDVIIPAYNCIVVPEAITYSGYTPKFVDIDLSSYNMTARGVEEAISSKTAVVIITHQFGIPSEVYETLEVCKRHNVLVVEDAAPAFGAMVDDKLVGSFGDAAIISFDRRKVLSGVQGGALLLDDPEIAQKIKNQLKSSSDNQKCAVGFLSALIWEMAFNSKFYPVIKSFYRLRYSEKLFEIVPLQHRIPNGYVKLCPNFTSSLILHQLAQLSAVVDRRNILADLYTNELTGHEHWELPSISKDYKPSWIQFPLLVDDKNKFYNYMQSKGIDLNWTFKYSCPDSFGLSGYPHAKRAALSVVGLPTYPFLTDEQAGYICETAKAYQPENQHI